LVSHIKGRIQVRDVGEQCVQMTFQPKREEAMGVETIVYRGLARKPEGNRPFSRPTK
jgi:hypothetical protein